MSTAMAVKDYMPSIDVADIEAALTVGDLSKMAPAVRVRYYLAALLDRIHELFAELGRTPDKYLAGLVQRAGVAEEAALPVEYLARAVKQLEEYVALAVSQREASVETTDTDILF